MGAGDSCAVCGRSVVSESAKVYDACGHVAHVSCVVPWTSDACVLCRAGASFKGPPGVAVVLMEGCFHCDALRKAIGPVENASSLPFAIVEVGRKARVGTFPHLASRTPSGEWEPGAPDTPATAMATLFVTRANAGTAAAEAHASFDDSEEKSKDLPAMPTPRAAGATAMNPAAARTIVLKSS